MSSQCNSMVEKNARFPCTSCQMSTMCVRYSQSWRHSLRCTAYTVKCPEGFKSPLGISRVSNVQPSRCSFRWNKQWQLQERGRGGADRARFSRKNVKFSQRLPELKGSPFSDSLRYRALRSCVQSTWVTSRYLLGYQRLLIVLSAIMP